MRKVPLAIIPPLVFAALAALFYWGMQREDANALPTALQGKPAPEVMLTPLGEGAPFDADALRAPGVKLVNFWASWCAPCRVEHPNLMALQADGVPIYGVNYKDDPAKALGFLAELGDPYSAMGADRDGRMALNWGLYGVPETFVIGGDGKIIDRIAGPLTQRVMDTRLTPLLEAAAE